MYTHVPRILCIEDHHDSRQLLAYVIGKLGWQVVDAPSFAEALIAVSKEWFDVYLIDLYLPDGDGLDICRQIRQLDPHVPVIVFTADARESTRQRAYGVGATEFLTKPLDPLSLRSLIDQHHQRSNLRSLEAKMEEIQAIRDEINLSLDRATEFLTRANTRSRRLEQLHFKRIARGAFASAGGTARAFDRLWPEVWEREIAGKMGEIID